MMGGQTSLDAADAAMQGDGNDDDLDLFRRELDALSGVRPIEDDRVAPERRRLRPVPAQRIADNARVVDELAEASPFDSGHEFGDELWYCRPGIQRKVLKRLRRGEYSMGEVIDLHGLTIGEAHAALSEFLADCRTRGVRGVRVIHGKGLSSPGGRPVIKGKVDTWLRHRDDVVAFCSARPVDGGTGAVYVLLRR